MSKLNQRGVVHLLVPLILLLGLVVGVYLVTSGNPLKLFSKASLSKPVGPETSFTLVGPTGCNAGPLCVLYERQTISQQFEVKVYVRSDVEKANLFTAKITFPKDLVEVTQIKMESGFIKNWVENYYDNATGEISLVGGVPSPGFQTTTGAESAYMATIVFNAKTTLQLLSLILHKSLVILTISTFLLLKEAMILMWRSNLYQPQHLFL
ncbi:hypothetical protein M1437_03490 [Patescibacteria group bacterium]|nr:hypothetical protein [Patescibacteria group bacterium]